MTASRSLPGLPAVLAAAIVSLTAVSPARAQAGPSAATPPEMVATYDALAGAILAVKKTESELVRSVLATTHAHAAASYERAKRAIAAKDVAAAKAELENLAALVGQMGTEGDSSVGRVRKRLLEGGHHHNSAGEAQGVYDEGYVIVTKAAKKSLVDASKVFAQLATAQNAATLDSQWGAVDKVFADLTKEKK